MEFKDVLRRLMLRNGLKNLDLAAALNLAPSTISNYITGKKFPNKSTLLDIAQYFKVTVDDLLGSEDQRSNNSSNIVSEPFVPYHTENLNKKESRDEIIDKLLKKIEEVTEEKLIYKLKLERCETSLDSLKNGGRGVPA